MKELLDLARPTPAGGSRVRRTTVGRRPKLSRQTRAAASAAQEITSRGNKILYPLDLPVRYEIAGGGSGSGCGRTIGVGSHHLVFSSDRMLEVNCKIRFTLDWPVSLPDGVGLKLWAFGTIIGADSNVVSVAFSRPEFRTCGKQQVELRHSCPEQV